MNAEEFLKEKRKDRFFRLSTDTVGKEVLVELMEEYAFSKWISVDERLPELTEPLTWWNDDTGKREVLKENVKATVLAYHPEIGTFKAEYQPGNWTVIAPNYYNGTYQPTHWQPLPNSPKQ